VFFSVILPEMPNNHTEMPKKQLFLLVTFFFVFAIFAIAAEPKYLPLDSFPVYGTLAPEATKKYSRLPDVLKDSIRDDLWNLGLHSAGISIRFSSDTKNIKLKWKSLNKFSMNHMTPTGIRGLDLYVMLPDSSWTTLGAARPSLSGKHSTSTIAADMKPEMREYMLFLSLYDGVDSVYIGVDSAAVVRMPAVGLPRRRPVVMYGTSILQGGCASRPGMAHTNILQRLLNREVVNLGFSGNARLDPEIADLMASADASAYVIDCLPNCTEKILEERLIPFYRRIRAVRPHTPILFVESPMFPISRFSTEVDSTLTAKNATFRRLFNEIAVTDPTVEYFEAKDILGGDPEATVDNYHFTDTGFANFAAALLPRLKRIIEPAGENKE